MYLYREIVVGYARETKLLFQSLLEAIIESLGSEGQNKHNKTAKTKQDFGKDKHGNGKENNYDNIKRDMENGSQLMVVNCYPPCPEPDLTFGMPPHSDYGFLTLLLQDEVEGLQILHKDHWVTIQPRPHSFVVNIGDHLEVCTYMLFS